MGEEVKKPSEEKKMEEKKKPEEEKKPEEKKENKEEKKSDESKGEKIKTPPPPPPQEIVLKVYMHCEGCARKVRRCLKGFPGVEDVTTDCKSHKVVVKGEKADPVKVKERVQRKSHRQVELLSPIPKPPAAEEEKKNSDEKEKAKSEEKKKEEKPPVVVTVVLKVHMHCEACAMEIKKRIQRIKGVESAEPDLKSSQVTVKGVFDPPNLVEYVYKRTGKHAAIVKQDPPPPPSPETEKKTEEEAKETKKDKKGEEEGSKDNKGKAESKDGGGGDGGGGGDDKKGNKGGEKSEDKKGGGGDGGGGDDANNNDSNATEEMKIVELKRNEYNYYPQRYVMEMYAYPPQIFSDENPNACSIM